MTDEPLLAALQVGDLIPTAVFDENGNLVGAVMCEVVRSITASTRWSARTASGRRSATASSGSLRAFRQFGGRGCFSIVGENEPEKLGEDTR